MNNTLFKIKSRAAEIMQKAAKGEKLTSDEIAILEIFTRMTAPTAGNAGKRKQRKTGK